MLLLLSQKKFQLFSKKLLTFLSRFDYYKKLADASEYCEEYSMTWVPPYVNQVYNSYADPLYTYTHYINEIAKAIEEIKPGCTATEQQRIDNQLAYWYKTVAEHLS